jgi:hypothetical protein
MHRISSSELRRQPLCGTPHTIQTFGRWEGPGALDDAEATLLQTPKIGDLFNAN